MKLSKNAARSGAFCLSFLLATGCQLVSSVDESMITTAGQGGATSQATSGTGGAGAEGGAGGQGGVGEGGQGGSGGQAQGTGGAGPECVIAEDCTAPENECEKATCKAGVCDVVDVSAGTPTATQIVGDCLQLRCDGAGNAVNVAVFNDPEDDGLPCTNDACDNGVPTHAGQPAGAPCNANGGVVCDALGACVECVSNTDCPGGACQAGGVCGAASCIDGTMNGSETDVDCGGGICAPCPDSGSCLVNADCVNQLCTGGLCVGISCSDVIKNGTETDVDCGGPTCMGCATGKSCLVANDCLSQICTGGFCVVPNCSDGIANGSETGVDCGGAASGCPACPDGQGCVAGTDCATSPCDNGICCSIMTDCTGLCGMVPGACGGMVDCGGCVAPEVCGGPGPNLCGCLPDAIAVTCAGKSCGSATNNCGDAVDCGTCSMPFVCGGNVCGCAPPCGGPTWAQKYGDGSTQVGNAVAHDATGNVFVTGPFQGTISFIAGQTLTSAGSDDIFIAKLSPLGVPLWASRFGDASKQTPRALAVDSAGSVIVFGDYAGTVNFGGGTLTEAGSGDLFVAKLDTNGTHVWSKRFGDSAKQTAGAVAVDPGGDILLTGAYAGSLDFGGGNITSTGADDVFVTRLTAAGGFLWNKSYGVGLVSTQSGRGIAVTPAGNVVIVGDFQGNINFGGGLLISAGGLDMFVAKLSALGAPIWSKQYGDAADQLGLAVAVDGSSNVLLTGGYQGSINFGGGALAANGLDDVYIAKLDINGNHVWSQRSGDSLGQDGRAVAVDSAGNVVVAGGFQGAVDFTSNASNPLNSAGNADVFVTKLDPAGAHLWSHAYGDASFQFGRSVTVDGAGDIVMTGDFQGTINFGSGALTTAGNSDVFLVKLSP